MELASDLPELPEVLVEKILFSMPLIDVVRTSVLSKDWQYKWRNIRNLKLDRDLLARLKLEYKEYDYVDILNSLMRQHTNPLEEFYLIIPAVRCSRIQYINQSIEAAVLRGVSKMTINYKGVRPFYLPPLPASPNLKCLELKHCCLTERSPFQGFPNLDSISFYSVSCPSSILHSITACSPNLKRIVLKRTFEIGLRVVIDAPKLEYMCLEGQFLCFSLENAQTLKVMEIHYFCDLKPCPLELVEVVNFLVKLEKLESLTFGGFTYELFENAGCLTRLPGGCDKLRFLKFINVHMHNVKMLRCILCLIHSSKNLRTLDIIPEAPSREEVTLELPSDEEFTLEHLEKIYIGPIACSKNEMKVIKHLLHCSPALQTIYIEVIPNLNEAMISRVKNEFKQIKCASTNVKMTLVH